MPWPGSKRAKKIPIVGPAAGCSSRRPSPSDRGLVEHDLARAFAAAEECDLLLAVGTTLAVYPIASMVPIAKEGGAKIVIVNGEATEMDAIADALLRGSISDILPALLPGS